MPDPLWRRGVEMDGVELAAVELDPLLRAVAAKDWLLIDGTVEVGRQGRVGVTGKVRHAGGHIAATGASQLCCVPAPP